MRKFFRVFFAVLVILSVSLSAFPISAFASNEDFTSWTEVDISSRLTISENSVTATNLKRTEIAYVYYDFGADFYNENFAFSFNVKSTEIGIGAPATAIALTNMTGTLADVMGASEDEIGFYYTSSPYALYAIELKDGALYGGNSISISLNTDYYITFWRDDFTGTYGTIGVDVYTDVGKTNHVGTSTLALHEKNDFRYIEVMQSREASGTSYKYSGYVNLLDLGAGTPPDIETDEATNIEYNPYSEWFEATLNAHIVDDGGAVCTSGFYYKAVADEEWAWGAGDTGLETSDNTTLALYQLLIDTEYQYYARADNSVGSDNISTMRYFDTGDLSTAPIVQTNIAYLDVNTDNESVTFYGNVLYDGGSYVTGWFEYREQGDEEWIVSDNVTSLATDDLWHINATYGMSVGIDNYYEYRAVGQNSENISYGSIGYFQFFEVEAPVWQVSDAYDITSTGFKLDAWFSNEGASSAWLAWQYREQGEDWNTLYGRGYYWVSYNETATQEFSQLKPNTVYEFRAWGGNDGGETYSDIKATKTFAIQQAPIIVTGDATYLSANTVNLNALVQYDGGSYVNVLIEYREQGFSEWKTTEWEIDLLTDGEANFTVAGLKMETVYEYFAFGINAYGESEGETRTFLLTAGGGGGTVDPSDNSLSDLISSIKSAIGLSGTVGTWAVLAIFILLVALVFGIAYTTTDNSTGKIAIGVTWIVAEVATVGMFLFSGELGVWPFFVLAGGIVALAIIFIGSKLSGGGNV